LVVQAQAVQALLAVPVDGVEQAEEVVQIPATLLPEAVPYVVAPEAAVAVLAGTLMWAVRAVLRHLVPLLEVVA
jgi:hypothetical protein